MPEKVEVVEEDKKEIDIFDQLQDPLQKKFLECLIETGGNMMDAAKAAGMKRWVHYQKWLKDPIYKEAFEIALDRSTSTLEAEAIRRAKGYDEPVFYRGEKVGTVKRYSDNLLMFLIKKRNPEYRDNNTTQIGIWGTDGSNVAINFDIPRPKQIQQKK